MPQTKENPNKYLVRKIEDILEKKGVKEEQEQEIAVEIIEAVFGSEEFREEAVIYCMVAGLIKIL